MNWSSFLCFLILCFLFNFSQGGLFDWFRLDRAATRRIDEGKEQFQVIKANAHSDICWQRPVQELEQGCRGLTSQDRGRLAVLLSSCHLARSGKKSYPCTKDMTLHECTEKMDGEGFNVYTQFSIHIDNICYYIESEYFQDRLERTINDLHRSAGEAQDVFVVLHEKTLKIDQNNEKVLNFQQELVTKHEILQGTIEKTAQQQAEAMEMTRDGLRNLKGISNTILSDSVEALRNQAKLLSDLGEVKYEQNEMKKATEMSLENQKQLLELQLKLSEQQEKVKEHAQNLLKNLEKLEIAQASAFSSTEERLLSLSSSSNETISKLVHHHNLISSTLDQLTSSLEVIKSFKNGISFDQRFVNFFFFYFAMTLVGLFVTWPSRTNKATFPIICGLIISAIIDLLIPEFFIAIWRLVILIVLFFFLILNLFLIGICGLCYFELCCLCHILRRLPKRILFTSQRTHGKTNNAKKSNLKEK